VSTRDATETLRNQATGRCLDALWLRWYHQTDDCDGTVYQKWNVHVWNDGMRELKSVWSGECLDDSDGYGLRAFSCNASRYQSWWVHRWNDGTIELKNQATGRCLDDSSAGLRTYPCNALPYQSWS
jgi:hypothetical protein